MAFEDHWPQTLGIPKPSLEEIAAFLLKLRLTITHKLGIPAAVSASTQLIHSHRFVSLPGEQRGASTWKTIASSDCSLMLREFQ